MKTWVYLLCFYVFVLTALPSIRAVKVTFLSHSEKQCDPNSKCETGAFVMTLNFSPVQFISHTFEIMPLNLNLYLQKKHTISYYKKRYFKIFQNNFWHPPKF